MAVVFAMLTSYLLTRTLVPTMVHYMLEGGGRDLPAGRRGDDAEGRRPHLARAPRLQPPLRRACANATKARLEWCARPSRLGRRPLRRLRRSARSVLAFVVGRDFFPYVDSGQMRLHVRAPEGTRIEETERIFATSKTRSAASFPPTRSITILDNIGLPNGGINLAFGDTATIGIVDGEILISLKPDTTSPRHSGIPARSCAPICTRTFPDETFFFQAANITNQILNFGLPAPIDIQVVGRDADRQLSNGARNPQAESPRIPGAVDVHIHQEVNTPDRQSTSTASKANQTGPHPARRRQQHADLAQLQRTGRAQSVAQSAQRRQLHGRRADAAIPHRFLRRPAAHAHHARRRTAPPQLLAQPRHAPAHHFHDHREPLQRAAGLRRLRQRRPARPRRRRRRYRQDSR